MELPLAEAEAYLRRLAMRSGTDEDPHKRVVYLVDGGGRLLAWADTATAADGSNATAATPADLLYAAPLGTGGEVPDVALSGSAALGDASSAALDRLLAGDEAGTPCANAIDVVTGSDSGSCAVPAALCRSTEMIVLPAAGGGGGDACALASPAARARRRDAPADAAGGGMPAGWSVRFAIGEADLYPGFLVAFWGTLVLSLLWTGVASLTLARFVWRYHDEAHLRWSVSASFPLLRFLPSTRRSVLIMIFVFVSANYVGLYLVWYTLSREATHGWRDAILFLLNEALLYRARALLALPPQIASLAARWAPLWAAAAPDAAAAAAFVPFSAALVDGAVFAHAAANASTLAAAAPPPLGRRSSAHLSELFYAPADGRRRHRHGVAADGAARALSDDPRAAGVVGGGGGRRRRRRGVVGGAPARRQRSARRHVPPAPRRRRRR